MRTIRRLIYVATVLTILQLICLSSFDLFASGPYQSIDITPPAGMVGTTTASADTIFVQGYGEKIWGDWDGFRYVYQDSISGDISITARVDSLNAISATASAGLMIRQEQVNNSRFMGIFIQNDGRVRSTRRNNTGSGQWASEDYIDSLHIPTGFPVWLRIEKVGGTVRTHSSTDGETWTQRRQQTIAFDNYYMGLAVTPWSATQTAIATFTEVSWPKITYALSTSAENGTIGLDPAGGVYIDGQEVEVTAVPETGYAFDSWGGDLSGSENPTTITMDGDKSITASFTEVTTYTLSTSAEDGIIVMNPAGGVYNQGQGVEVTAVPDSGYVFDSWGGDLSGSVNPTTITMDANKTITASFTEIITHTLSTSTENGTIELNPTGGVYSQGQEVEVTAVPETGFAFDSWDGDLSGSENPTTITMDAEKSITAIFTEVTTYTLSTSAENGTIELDPAGGIYNQGQVVQVTALPDSGYVFDSWGGDLSGSDNPTTITMDADKSVTAIFTAIPTYTLSVTAENGTITLNPEGGEYEEGEIVQVTVIPNSGYAFGSWSGDISGIDNPAAIIMDGNKSITAISYQISYNSIDINPPAGMEGSTIESAGEITVQAYGEKIWGDWDGMRYVYQDGISGDISFTARVDSMNAIALNASAGVMIRQELGDTSRFMGIFIQNDGRLRSTRRNNTGSGQWANQDYIDPVDSPTGFPVWLRIEKEGTTITTYSSTDGDTWTQRWQQNIAFEDNYFIGLAVTPWSATQMATAIFSNVAWLEITHTLATAAENGSIVLNPEGGVYSKGDVVEVTAIPDSGFVFETWGGNLSGSENPTTIAMNTDKSISASFVPDTSYTLTVNAENGAIELNPEGGVYYPGVEVELTAVPDSGFVFVNWEGDLSGSANPASIIMDGGKSITAIFSSDTLVETYTLSTSAENGSIKLSPVGGVYIAGSQVNVIAMPDSGYVFESWGGDLSGSESPTTITMDENKSITASFTQVVYQEPSYKSIDINPTAGREGSTTEIAGEITVQAYGEKIWGDWDGMRYVYQDSLSGNISFTARVDSLNAISATASAGVMIRQELGDSSRFMGIFIQNDGRLRSTHRSNTGSGQWAGQDYIDPVDSPTGFPVWLRIEKAGITITTYSSTDGETWIQRGQRNIAFEDDYFVGLAVTPWSATQMATAIFSEVVWPEVTYSLITSAENGSIVLSPEGGFYNPGEVVELTAVPVSGYVFESWGGDLSGSENPATITMDANKSVTATFIPDSVEVVTYTITASAENGSIELSPAGGVYEAGVEVQITAVPDIGFVFQSWSGDLSGSANPATIIMNADKSITATFLSDTLVETYSLTATAENGTIEMNPVGGVYIAGAEVQVTAVPDSGYVFEGWSGDLSGSSNPVTITMDGDKSITATFLSDTLVETYTLTTSAENGSIGMNPIGGVYIAGTEVQITAVPDSGYVFNGWSGDISGSENPTIITMDDDKSVIASFITITQSEVYTLSATAVNGSIELNPAGGEYEAGVEVQVTAMPESGYEFEGWSGDLSGNTNPTTIIMDGDKSITAIFVETSTSVALKGVNQTGFSMDIYPNPFNISTNISLQLEARADIHVQILDISGRLIWSTQLKNMPEGQHSVVWNSQSMSGSSVGAGVYFCNVRVVMPSSTHIQTKRIMIK